MSFAHEDTLLNDDEVVEVVSVATSLNGSECSAPFQMQTSVPFRGRWTTESPPPEVEVVKPSARNRKKSKKLQNYSSAPPPPPPPLPNKLDRIPMMPPSKRRAMFLGCLQCTNLIVIRYNHSQFHGFEPMPHPYTMAMTTCRTCLKSQRSSHDEPTTKAGERCEAAVAALQLSVEFIETSYIYKVASAVVSSAGEVVALENPRGVAAYIPVSALVERLDSDCIALGMTFNKSPDPPRADKVKVLSYLPGGFL